MPFITKTVNIIPCFYNFFSNIVSRRPPSVACRPMYCSCMFILCRLSSVLAASICNQNIRTWLQRAQTCIQDFLLFQDHDFQAGVWTRLHIKTQVLRDRTSVHMRRFADLSRTESWYAINSCRRSTAWFHFANTVTWLINDYVHALLSIDAFITASAL